MLRLPCHFCLKSQEQPFFGRYTTKWEQLIAMEPPQLAKDIPSSLFPFSIFSLFIYKFRYYQTIVSNNPNDKRRNLGWNHNGTIGVTKFVVKGAAQDIKYGGFIEW